MGRDPKDTEKEMIRIVMAVFGPLLGAILLMALVAGIAGIGV